LKSSAYCLLLEKTGMSDRITVMAHKTDGKDSVVYYVTNLPEWWEFMLLFSAYAVIAMTVFYTGLWIASKYR